MKCECQLCGEIKEIYCWSPENKETTFKLFGISGSNLPICQPCMIKKHQNPEFMIKSLEEFARLLRQDLKKQKEDSK